MTVKISFIFFLVWCFSTTPLLSFTQEEVPHGYMTPCEDLCKDYYISLKELWRKDTTDSVYRYKPFSHGKSAERGKLLRLIMYYPECCVVGQSKSEIISLFGKPDAIVSDEKTFSYCYFIKKESYSKYLKIKDEVFKLKELWVIKVSFDCKTKRVTKQELV